ncbi:3-phosphoshikimate 1-carboxyvinyltransferase [Candidatus Gracilibacteria bacterium]|nr:3-phosphoshikimate 1-carboxyvinyltransferase [Candidatus Gracilibacteria bacterium]
MSLLNTFTVPGSKSMTNRALLIAAATPGKTIIHNGLESDDTKVMQKALKELGVKIIKKKNTLTVVSPQQYNQTKNALFCGNSGTTVRFLTALLASQKNEYVIDGDARMRERPIGDLVDALRNLGATITYQKKEGYVPLRVHGPFTKTNSSVRGETSSQYLSALLMSAGASKKTITIKVRGKLVSKPYIDMTIELMKQCGAQVKRTGYTSFAVTTNGYHTNDIYIEGDASAATYFWGLSALTGYSLEITNVSNNTLQPDSAVKIWAQKICSSKEKKLTIDARDFPDGAMTLIVLSALIPGEWKFIGLHNLRVKESDRLHALATELTKIGVKIKEHPDGITVIGQKSGFKKAKIQTYNDHRIAMCFGMIQTILPHITIMNPECVSKTYPQFWKDLGKVRCKIAEQNIVLTGMRGSGKSFLGKRLAKKLKRTFIDTDEEICKKIKQPIADFVREKGWPAFRAIERSVVRKLSYKKNAVISTGGGVIMDERNVSELKKNGRIIFLHCTIDILKKRLQKDTERPSLTQHQNVINELPAIFKQRLPYYEQTADARLPVSDKQMGRKMRSLIAITQNWGIL